MTGAPLEVSRALFRETCESYTGFCRICKDFTTDTVEPDAEGYDCTRCGEPQVYGAEQALLMGLIEVRNAPQAEEDED